MPSMPFKSTIQRVSKQVLFVLASVFLVFQSFGLLSGMDYYAEISFWPAVFLAWVINMFITGIFAFAGFALPTHRLLPARYYEIANPAQLKWFYQVFGVERFRKLLLATLWRSKAQQQKYFNGRPDGLDHLAEQSQKSEFGHLLPFLILTVVGIYIVFFRSACTRCVVPGNQYFRQLLSGFATAAPPDAATADSRYQNKGSCIKGIRAKISGCIYRASRLTNSLVSRPTAPPLCLVFCS